MLSSTVQSFAALSMTGLDLQHGVLGAQLAPGADHRVGIQIVLLNVTLPPVHEDVFKYLPYAEGTNKVSVFYTIPLNCPHCQR